MRIVKCIYYTPLLFAIDIYRIALKLAGWFVDMRLKGIEREMERRGMQNDC